MVPSHSTGHERVRFQDVISFVSLAPALRVADASRTVAHSPGKVWIGDDASAFADVLGAGLANDIGMVQFGEGGRATRILMGTGFSA